jgi:2-methylisocitrate lyase-like PEP mutase family enzyme
MAENGRVVIAKVRNNDVMADHPALCQRFRELHERQQVFLIPNPWDIGSARLLESLGFEALATSSSGLAASLGCTDMTIGRDAVVAHVAALTASIDIPLNVDSERCYSETLDGVAETAAQLAQAGAAGFSIEDWRPSTGTIDPTAHAAERVASVVAEAHRGPDQLIVTARAENFLRGFPDIDDTIARLIAYRDAGADVVYAPGLIDINHIKRVVDEVGLPVNVIALPGGPTVAELGAVGVRRVSTGPSLAKAAYGAMVRGAQELLVHGTSTYTSGAVSNDDLKKAFGPR